MTTRARALPLVALLLLAVTCGGRPQTPSAPTPSPTVPSTPTPPPTRWSFTGRVVDTVTGAPVPGAVLEPTGFPAVTADASGEFFFQADTWPEFSPFSVTVRAEGFITREAQITWERGARTGVDIGLIRDAPPFSLDFYRQLVRNAYATPETLQPLRRWSEPPRFYVRAVEEGSGRAVETEVLAFVQEWLARAVPMWTGWPTPVIETGSDGRPDQPGWIRVVFIRTTEPICGRSFVGRDPGLITFTLDVCDCGSRKVPPDTIIHEVGHALGFWHVQDRQSVMYPIDPGGCRPSEISALERHHATIAYRRLAGSTDVDRDFNQTGLRVPLEGDDGILVVD